MNYLQKRKEQQTKKSKRKESKKNSKVRQESLHIKGTTQTEKISSNHFNKATSLEEVGENKRLDSNDADSPAINVKQVKSQYVSIETNRQENAKQDYNNSSFKKENKHKSGTKNDDMLLLKLMQKNVKDGAFTPEQKALYEAHDVLIQEYKRRRDQRKRVGDIFKKNTRTLKSILQQAMVCRKMGQFGESDLALKARGNALQERRKEKKRKFTTFAVVADSNQI